MSKSHGLVPSPKIHGISPPCTRFLSFHALIERYRAACLVFRVRGLITVLSVIVSAKVHGSLEASNGLECSVRCSPVTERVPPHPPVMPYGSGLSLDK
jgi:hypothetical protein